MAEFVIVYYKKHLKRHNLYQNLHYYSFSYIITPCEKEELMNIRKIIITLILSFTCFTSFTLFSQEVKADETNTTITYEIEVNSIVNNEEIKNYIINYLNENNTTIDINEVDIKNSNLIIDKIDTSTLGDHLVNASLSVIPLATSKTLIANTLCFKLNLKVIDSKSPVIKLSKNAVFLKIDEEFDPWTLLEYTYDNSDIYPTVNIINNTDTTIEGEYYFVVSSCDSSNNETKVTVPVYVSNTNLDLSEVEFSGDNINYMLELINLKRAENGLNPYELGDSNAQLATAVRVYEVVTNNLDISHRRPDGSHYKTAFDEYDVEYYRAPLEILTYSGNTIEDKLNWWMNSSGHSSILLQSDYTHIALASLNGMWCGIAY